MGNDDAFLLATQRLLTLFSNMSEGERIRAAAILIRIAAFFLDYNQENRPLLDQTLVDILRGVSEEEEE